MPFNVFAVVERLSVCFSGLPLVSHDTLWFEATSAQLHRVVGETFKKKKTQIKEAVHGGANHARGRRVVSLPPPPPLSSRYLKVGRTLWSLSAVPRHSPSLSMEITQETHSS